MATLVPNVVFNVISFLGLNPLLSQNFTAVNTALGERVVGHRATVTRYAATGATTSKITIGSVSPPGSTPWAVMLVRVHETSDPGKDLPVTGRLNFAWDGASKTLYVYEPQGLTTNTLYDMSFLVLE